MKNLEPYLKSGEREIIKFPFDSFYNYKPMRDSNPSCIDHC